MDMDRAMVHYLPQIEKIVKWYKKDFLAVFEGKG